MRRLEQEQEAAKAMALELDAAKVEADTAKRSVSGTASVRPPCICFMLSCSFPLCFASLSVKLFSVLNDDVLETLKQHRTKKHRIGTQLKNYWKFSSPRDSLLRLYCRQCWFRRFMCCD